MRHRFELFNKASTEALPAYFLWLRAVPPCPPVGLRLSNRPAISKLRAPHG